MDGDTISGVAIILVMGFAPFLLAITRKHSHWLLLLVLNIIDFGCVLVAITSPSAISISIAGIFWIILWNKSFKGDNRCSSKVLRERLKSIEYCQNCMGNSQYIKDLYRDKGIYCLLDDVYELTAMDKTNSLSTKLLGFSNQPSKKTVDEYKKCYKAMLKEVRLSGPTCTNCKDKVRDAIRKHLMEFSPVLYKEAQIFTDSNDITKQECPFCSEMVETNAIKCPYCAENLE